MTKYLSREKLRYTFSFSLLFAISPILALPGIVFGIIKKYRFALTLLALGFALIGYQIIPSSTSDLADHYSFYEIMKGISFENLFFLIKENPDFLFYVFMLVCSKAGISAQWVTFISTFITVNNFLKVYHHIFKNSSSKLFFFGIILIILSFKWSLVFLGVRNYLAFSFVILAIYNGIILQKKNSFWWLVIASFIHFSSVAFVPIYWLLLYTQNRGNLSRNFFLGSFIFLLFSKQILLELFLLIPLPSSFNYKIVWYLGKEDIIEQAISESIAAHISFIIQFSWVYVGYLYLLFTINRKSLLRNTIYILFFMLNLFFAAPDPFNRFTFVVRPLFAFLLLYEVGLNYKKFWLYIFTGTMVLFAVVDLYITKNIYFWSLFNVNSLTTVGILIKDYFIQQVDG